MIHFYPGDIVRDNTGTIGIVTETVEYEPNKFNAERTQVTATVHYANGKETRYSKLSMKELTLIREAMSVSVADREPAKMIRKFIREIRGRE
jgi:hypothetical protein